MEIRDRIIACSIELFTKSGIRFVTMDQIAAELGISKRTLYEIFHDKDNLLKQCLEVMVEQGNTEMQEVLNNSKNTIEALYLIGQHGEKKRATINHLFFDDIEKLYPDFRKIFTRRKTVANDSISYKIIKKGIVEGIFRKEINLEIVDTFLHEMMRICHNKELFPEYTGTKEIVKNIVIPYFRGISTEKGQVLIDRHFPLNEG